MLAQYGCQTITISHGDHTHSARPQGYDAIVTEQDDHKKGDGEIDQSEISSPITDTEHICGSGRHSGSVGYDEEDRPHEREGQGVGAPDKDEPPVGDSDVDEFAHKFGCAPLPFGENESQSDDNPDENEGKAQALEYSLQQYRGKHAVFQDIDRAYTP